MKPYAKYNLALSIVRDSGSEEKDKPFPKIRHQQVDVLYRTLKEEVPELWLHGEWLREAGIDISDEVRIEVYPGQLIIKLVSKGGYYEDQWDQKSAEYGAGVKSLWLDRES